MTPPAPVLGDMEPVLDLIARERDRQDNHPDHSRGHHHLFECQTTMAEEFGEVAKAINEWAAAQAKGNQVLVELWRGNLQVELIQLAALAVKVHQEVEARITPDGWPS